MVDKRETPMQIPLNWEVPDELMTKFTNNVVVQNSGEVFILSFFETLPPVILGTEVEVANQLKNISSIKAKCVGRFIIPASIFPAMAQVMMENYNKYEKSREEGSGSDGFN